MLAAEGAVIAAHEAVMVTVSEGDVLDICRRARVASDVGMYGSSARLVPSWAVTVAEVLWAHNPPRSRSPEEKRAHAADYVWRLGRTSPDFRDAALTALELAGDPWAALGELLP